jgi:hypothetical protein
MLDHAGPFAGRTIQPKNKKVGDFESARPHYRFFQPKNNQDLWAFVGFPRPTPRVVPHISHLSHISITNLNKPEPKPHPAKRYRVFPSFTRPALPDLLVPDFNDGPFSLIDIAHCGSSSILRSGFRAVISRRNLGR